MLLFRFTILNIFVLLVYKFSGTTSQTLVKQHDSLEIERSSQISQFTLTLNGLDLFSCDRYFMKNLYCHSNKELSFNSSDQETGYDTCLDGEDNRSHKYLYFLYLCKSSFPIIKFATKDGYVYTSTNQDIVNGKQSVEFTKEKIRTISDNIPLDNIPVYNTCDEGNPPTKQLYCNSDRNFTFVRDHNINSYEKCLPEEFKNINSDSYDYNEANISLRCDKKTQKMIINLNSYLCVYKIATPGQNSLDLRFVCDYHKHHLDIRKVLPELNMLPIFSAEEGKVTCFDGYFLEDIEKYKAKFDDYDSNNWRFIKTEDGKISEPKHFPKCKLGCTLFPKFLPLGINIYENEEKRHTILICGLGRFHKDVPSINPECRTTAKDVYNWYWNGEIFHSFEDMGCIPNTTSYLIPVTLRLNGFNLFQCNTKNFVKKIYCHSNKELNFNSTNKESNYSTCLGGQFNPYYPYAYFLYICESGTPSIRFFEKEMKVYTYTNTTIMDGVHSLNITAEKSIAYADKQKLDNFPKYYPCDKKNPPIKKIYCNSVGNFTLIRDQNINSYEGCLPKEFKDINSDSYDYKDASISLRCNEETQNMIINLPKYSCLYRTNDPFYNMFTGFMSYEHAFICQYQAYTYGFKESLLRYKYLPAFNEKEGEVVCFDGYFLKNKEKYKIEFNIDASKQWKLYETKKGKKSEIDFRSCKLGCKVPTKYKRLGIEIYEDSEKRHAILKCKPGRSRYTNDSEINPECRTNEKNENNWYWNGEIFDSFEDMGCIRNLNTEIKTSTDEDEDINNNVQSSNINQANTQPNSKSSATQDQRTDSGTNTYIENLLNSHSVGRGINIPTDEDEEKKKTVQSSKPDQSTNIPKSESSTTQDQHTDSETNTDIEKPLDSNSVEREKSVNKLPLIKEESQEEEEDKKTNLISPEDLHIFTPKKNSSDDKTTSAGIKNHPYYKWIIVSILIIVWN